MELVEKSITVGLKHRGKIVIPEEIRRRLDLSYNSRLPVYTDGKIIILKPQKRRRCVCKGTNSKENQLYFYNKSWICGHCLKGIQDLTYRKFSVRRNAANDEIQQFL